MTIVLMKDVMRLNIHVYFLKEEGVVRFCLDRKIVSYFVSKMSKRIRRDQDDLWRTDYF